MRERRGRAGNLYRYGETRRDGAGAKGAQGLDRTLKLITDLTEADGVPGFEEAVRQVMRRYLEPVSDEVVTDHLGSIAGKKVGAPDGPVVMLAGHLDEVGFMVTMITEEGFIKFIPLGGWWEQVMLAQRVTVHTHKGRHVGVIGSKPPHILTAEERNKVVKKTDMFIDIGATSRAEAEAAGVRPGDPIVPICPCQTLVNPNLIMAKAWDNRYGCAAAIDVLHNLQGKAHPNIVYGAGTVQEEVGLRGATTSTNLIKPDVGFALDVGIAGDTPEVKAHEAMAGVGKGPVLLLYDATMVPHLKLRNLVIETARAEGIPLQFDAIAGGGTDAGRMHIFGAGVPSVVISVATRYIHSAAAVFSRRDYEQAVQLLTALVHRLDRATVTDLKVPG